MNTQLIELRELAEAATPGPWHITKSGDSHWMREVRDIDGQGVAFCGGEIKQSHKDAEYITAANPAKVIELLDALQSQAELINALEREIERLTESLRYEVDCVAAIGAERDDLRVQLDALQVDDELPELPKPYDTRWDENEVKAYARQAQAMARAKMVPLEKDAARYLHICEQDFKDRQWVDSFADFKKARDASIDAAMGITGEPK